jgi:hypothetical protein
MMNRRLPAFLAFASTLGLTLMACGSETPSQFGNGNGNDGGTNNGADPEGTFSEDPLGKNGVFAACASSAADTKLTPANLIITYDKSGSMGNPQEMANFDASQRWIPVGKGMTDFLADPKSSGMNASLQFFPLGTGPEWAIKNDSYSAIWENNHASCVYDYSNPRVPLTSLNQSQVFVDAINNTNPGGGTPTLPAIRGAITYAKKVVGERPPKEKTVVVLVSDGEPGMVIDINKNFAEGCVTNQNEAARDLADETNNVNANTVAHVSDAVRGAFQGTPSIPTYVIGIGPSVAALNQVASAGGTDHAFLVDINDPTKTKGVFQSALEQIRSQNLSCDFTIPTPPDGRTLDINSVNVVYERSADGKFEVLSYSKECADGKGWKYDDPSKPQNVTLCPATCSAIQSDANGKLRLAFGCATKGDLK